MSLACTVAGIAFQNPILLASGTAGYGRELAGIVDLEVLGGIVTKAVSREPRAGNLPPRVAECRAGMINSVGLANPGVTHVIEDDLPWIVMTLRRPRIIINIVGFSGAEFADVISHLESSSGHAGYELNLSCPNTSSGGLEFGATEQSAADVVSRCRAVTARPLFVKLSPALPNIPDIAAATHAAGADGITLVNTLPGFLYQDSTAKLGNGFGGVSGPALLATGLLAVQRTAQRLPNVPIIGVGGVRSTSDVKDYLRAGASLVAIGTAALADPRLPERIVAELHRG